VLLFVLTCIDTEQNGLFTQKRVGQYAKPFTIYKLRSIARITPEGKWIVTRFGKFLRRYKLDELPQFVNVLKGDMSIVGPRPDIPGYYDKLEGKNREVLKLKPGLTGPSNLKYWDEEYELAKHPDPLWYNDNVLFPDKVKINLCYLKKQTLWLDIKIVAYTLVRKKFPDDFFKC
jgi:lipopolysaccharide/colanic/teichoic acid biosynthesis glycosyltransferase